MKIKFPIAIFLLITSLNVNSQNLSLSDLHNITSVKNWENANQYLLNKGWEYYESSKGDSNRYNTITWSFNRSYEDKASGWFYVYTFDREPNKITYTTFNKSSYSAIQKALKNYNYKLLDSKIKNNEITSEYSNQNYILKINTDKREGSSRLDESITGYRFELIKKYGTFDSNNGEKIEYDDYGNISMIYNLKDGVFHGDLKVYHPNGKLKKTGSHYLGDTNGDFVEYDEEGNTIAEYTILKGMRNGPATVYANGRKSYTTHYIKDEVSGEHINYIYTDEGKLFFKEYGQYLDGKKIGLWKTISLAEDEKVLFKTTFKNGIKEGVFQLPHGDSLTIGNYKNDKLHGSYKVYLDVKRILMGGLISTDTTKLQILTEGNYDYGNKTGKWNYYDFTKTLREEGFYAKDLKQGQWKYYYTKYMTDDKTEPYSGKLYLIENYKYGKLDGKSQRLSYLNKVETPCPEEAERSKDCWKFSFVKVDEMSNYEGGELHGEYSYKDTNSSFTLQGSYEYGEEEGEWIKKTLYNEDSDPTYVTEVGHYTNAKKNGKWKEYIGDYLWREISYKLGVLDGDYTVFSKSIPTEKRIYNIGKLKQFTVLDSTGINFIDRLDYIHTTNKGSLWNRTNPIGDLTMTQEYTVNADEAIHEFSFEFILRNQSNSDSNDYNTYRDGKFQLLENNIPQIVGYFINELKAGEWTYYYYDQGVKIQSDFIDDEKQNEKYLTLQNELFDGTFIYTNSEENIREERRVRDGLRDGTTKYIDLLTDKTIEKEKYKEGVIK
ncbi:toxin-antitoxin system YwqK family antitoxin [Gillisia sp. JM1]|uniref:toxin-antitoxin system YwqK family antitoxin n=1 Tax=Gillisia sp. JM1 TaxID=1283286 RepID=UPI00040072DA|nr:hypothetical protein [Gillisia sp. JM1]